MMDAKDLKEGDMRNELDKISNQITHTPSEDPHLALRIRELKNLIEDLKTQNIQQRLEISKLRKK